MLAEKGFVFHDDIFKTYSGHPTYYVKEYRRTHKEKLNMRPMTALECLEEFRNKQIS